MDFYFAVYVAQREGMIEARRDHRPIELGDHGFAVTGLREAIAAQLLTPAPDVASIKWKRRAFAKNGWRRVDVTAEEIEQQIERAIAEDVAFLAAHPVRRSNSQDADF
jgi:hypothetical protein